MPNARGKSIDNTHLSVDQAEKRGFIHRDYIAHCMRWTYVCNRIAKCYRTTRMLDIGCGVDLALPRLLYASRYIVERYIGLDYNSASKFDLSPFHTGKFPLTAYGNIDFANDDHVCLANDPAYFYVKDDEHLLPNIFTSFEVLEHVEPSHTRRIVKKLFELMTASKEAGNSPVAIISTPCYDAGVGAADNHVSEITRDALGGLFEDLGYSILENYGTFASQRDYRDEMFDKYPDSREIWNRLKGFYDSNYIATLFAPMFPHAARNNLWVLGVAPKEYVRKFKPLFDVEGEWTSNANWKDLNG